MGACSSKKAEGIPEEEMDKRREMAKKARRKLSLAPDKVDEINLKFGKSNAKATEDLGAVMDVTRQSQVGGSVEDDGTQGLLRRPLHVMISQKGVVGYSSKKVNQDRAVVKYALKRNGKNHLFGVMDGHGEFGHFVSQFVQENLPVCLENCGDMETNPENAILVATKTVCAKLAETNIQLAFSGTTLVYGLLLNQMLYVANVGDSRAIICREVPTDANTCQVVELSYDQKPENPGEKERILAAGGRVQPLPGPPDEDCGPHRVWLADVDVPGLAMSRSVGDEVSQTVGVISVPEIIKHEVIAEDRILIMASDGIWEFISNEEAADIVWSRRNDLKSAAKVLVQEATARWKAEEEVIDDITCVIVMLEYMETDASAVSGGNVGAAL